MIANLQAYKAHLQAPWGKLQYEIVFAFLVSLRTRKFLISVAVLGLWLIF